RERREQDPHRNPGRYRAGQRDRRLTAVIRLQAALPAQYPRMVPTNATVPRSRFRSQRIAQFTESVIREMTRLAVRHGAINLAQGFPDFTAPAVLKNAAVEAIDADINQYAITWGAKPFRDPIAAKYQ